ncbi:MAG: glutamate-5-semialdehyde dehydrogenase [Stappiaceae bacterium]
MLTKATELSMNALSSDEINDLMNGMGENARKAARILATTPTTQKNAALIAMAAKIRAAKNEILEANAIDVRDMIANARADSFVERGTLDGERIEAIAQSIEAIAELSDPVGSVAASWERPNGLQIDRVRTPLGVIGVIYESRPNVTADAGTLCLKAGNAVILRGGSDSHQSSTVISQCLADGLSEAGLPGDAIQLVPTTDRAAVGAMLSGLNGAIDVIVPRGGKSLVARVQDEARVPVFAHLEGLVHIYVHKDADPELARDIVVNAKMRRTSICGAAETLLIDREIAGTMLPLLAGALEESGCRIRADEASRAIVPGLDLANEADWRTEYLDSIIAAKLVDGPDEAINHIETYGSNHTDCIVTADQNVADEFMRRVDSAIVMHNASTQFADGGEFGMGAEIGIATGRMHARGPVGLEQLTSFKYCVRGSGQIRP